MEGFPVITESAVSTYLKARSGFTKNYRTGVRLCQCGHIFDLEMASTANSIYIKAKCRPNMHKIPPFYSLFVVLNVGVPKFANCKCPAGESQTCIHIATLLITLSEVTPQA